MSKHPTVAIILGMHRSGTSAVTGALRSLGLPLGNVLDAGFEHNPTGLQEPAAVLYMHEDLLIKNGGSWRDPTDVITWSPLHLAVRDLFVDRMNRYPIWGFKDPRTVLVLDRWLEVLPNAVPLGVVRHPLDVATSINRRNGTELSEGLKIWTRYNQRLKAHHDALGFDILLFGHPTFDIAEPIYQYADRLGLPREADMGVLDMSIPRGRRDPSHALPADIQCLYDELCERAQ